MLLHHDLPSGARVRLRLPVRSDVPSLRALLGDRETLSLLRFDPSRRAVICAVDFEEVVGVGAIDLCPGARPDLITVADGRGEELTALLERVLVARAEAAHRPARPRRGLLRRARRP
jgi:hypothetical protein